MESSCTAVTIECLSPPPLNWHDKLFFALSCLDIIILLSLEIRVECSPLFQAVRMKCSFSPLPPPTESHRALSPSIPDFNLVGSCGMDAKEFIFEQSLLTSIVLPCGEGFQVGSCNAP